MTLNCFHPKHFMSHEETTRKKGRSQTKESKRITNVCNSDRRDMRPIDEYFTPGKRKATGHRPSQIVPPNQYRF